MKKWINTDRLLSLLFYIVLACYVEVAVAGPIEDLQPGHWYEVPNSKLEEVFPNPAPPGYPSGVTSAWSGGAYDTKRDRLIVWGGGHRDYAGNEIYVFDINLLKWTRLTDPSTDVGGDQASGLYPDGKPRARHTYDYIEYLPNIDRFCSFGGAVPYPNGDSSDSKIHCFDFNSLTWNSTDRAQVPYGGLRIAGLASYDPATGHVWYHSTTSKGQLSKYDPINDEWTVIKQNEIGYDRTAAIDPTRHIMVITGKGTLMAWDLDNPTTVRNLSAKGDTSIQFSTAPGFTYDSASDRFVAWNGGDSVYTLDPDTWTWTKITPAATNTVVPSAPVGNGTFGRFRYVPSKNVFVLYNHTNSNVYIYKLTGSNGTPQWPVVNLETSSGAIDTNQSVTLTWTTSNADSCTASGSWSGAKAVNGSITIGPLTESATFELSCTGAGGSTSASVDVSVGVAGPQLATNTSPPNYEWDILTSGVNVYIDRNYTYTSIPSTYVGLDVLKTGNDDKASNIDNFITFDVDQAVTVYVAHAENGASLPSWLLGWTATGDQLGTTDRNLNIYSKNFPAGTIPLGGNESAPSMYTVLLAASISTPGDTDGDGLPDDWEQTHFGNLNRNGTQDEDGDGLSNLDEYRHNTNPTLTDSDADGDSDLDEVTYGSDPNLGTDTLDSHRPSTPYILAIGNSVSIGGHTFTVSGFSDPDNDQLGASQWQIGTDNNFGTLIMERTLEGTDSLVISQGILKSNTSYMIRTRHQDNSGLWSDWSASIAFTTAGSEANDVDQNGIDDRYQVSGPVDTDKNNISDSDEGMCNLTDAGGAQVLGFRSNMGTVHCFSVLNAAELPPGSTTADFPFGMFSFGVEDLPVDPSNPVTVNLTVYFAEPLAAGTRWYKYDPSTGVVTDYTSNVSINGNAVVVMLTDGGVGDADGVVNGIIVDPSGPSLSTSGGGGSGAGGSITGGSDASGSVGGGGSMGSFELYFGLMGLLLSLALRSKKVENY